MYVCVYVCIVCVYVMYAYMYVLNSDDACLMLIRLLFRKCLTCHNLNASLIPQPNKHVIRVFLPDRKVTPILVVFVFVMMQSV